MKKALLIPLVAILIITGSSFAYTYTTATDIISVDDPTGDIVSSNATATQPDWESVVPVTSRSRSIW
ncbi:hypothetical protein ACFLWW_03175 [Chloroflexota bacterium]